MIKKLITEYILFYFRVLAKLQLKKNSRAIIIGITGSAGKTSARLALAQILKNRGRVKHSHHANSESGIPLNILGISPSTYSSLDWIRMIILAPIMLIFNWERYDFYVVEMGIDSANEPKNMGYLLKIIRPHIGVILNAKLTHSAGFDHLVKDSNPTRRIQKLIGAIAKEKMRLLHGIAPHGVAVINIDQKELVKECRGIRARQISYGKSKKASLHILKVENNSKGFIFKFNYQGQIHELALKDILSEQYAYTFAASIATAAAIGVPPSVSVQALSLYRTPAGRLRIFEGINESTLIDSSYNASPSTMEDALILLKKIARTRFKIAVIGDMRELGSSEKSVHKSLADSIPKYCDQVILFGALTKKYTYPVLKSIKFPVTHFEKMNDLNIYLNSIVKKNSAILFKGSQNTIFLERSVESALLNPSDAKYLCRRGPYWDKIRASTL